MFSIEGYHYLPKKIIPVAECIKCGVIVNKYLEMQQEEPEVYETPEFPVQKVEHLKIKNGVTITLLVGMVLLFVALFQKDKLPDANQIRKSLYQEPKQTQTRALAFKTKIGDKTYTITPLYGYELWGLVVSYYDSTGWWDITHKFLWKDLLNVKDICVLYGFNVRTDAYKEMKFKSGSWTCHAKLSTERAQLQFFDRCLSNNHLLSDRKDVKKAVMRAKRGDQIYLKGYLAAYARSGSSFFRGSSTTRTDTGDGACETIYLEEFKILKKANTFWRILFSTATYLIAACIIV